MFTGIIEATAPILERTEASLMLARPSSFDDLKIGSSVAISGVCLTVIMLDAEKMTFNVVPETWSKTKLETLHPGDRVNLERALRADSRLDGHIVQGHVEGIGELMTVVPEQSGARMSVRLPVDLAALLAPKGSITVDGVSLTIAACDGNTIQVALIPETLQSTTLGVLRPGSFLNIETDILGRYVYTFLRRSQT